MKSGQLLSFYHVDPTGPTQVLRLASAKPSIPGPFTNSLSPFPLASSCYSSCLRGKSFQLKDARQTGVCTITNLPWFPVQRCNGTAASLSTLALGPPPSLCDWARTATPATQGLPGVLENELLSEQTSRVSKTFKLWQQLRQLISQDP